MPVSEVRLKVSKESFDAVDILAPTPDSRLSPSGIAARGPVEASAGGMFSWLFGGRADKRDIVFDVKPEEWLGNEALAEITRQNGNRKPFIVKCRTEEFERRMRRYPRDKIVVVELTDIDDKGRPYINIMAGGIRDVDRGIFKPNRSNRARKKLE